MAVAAADIAPKAFQQLVKEGGEHQDVEDDLQVPNESACATAFGPPFKYLQRSSR